MFLVGLVVQLPLSASTPAGSSPAGVALAHRAERLKAALTAGDPGAIDSAAHEVELLRRNYGTLDVAPLVEAMAIWAQQLGSQGNPDLGLKVVHLVEQRWAPRNPTLLGTRIILLRQEGIRGYILSLPDVADLTRLRLAHSTHRWLWIVQHAAWLRMMATLVLWGWALALALRYRKVLRYLWEEPLAKRGLGAFPMALIGAFLLAFPILLGFDPSVAALLWIWLLAPYFHTQEAKATYLVIALQLLHPALAMLEPMAQQVPEPSIVTMQVQPQPKALEDNGIRRMPLLDQEFLKGWEQLQSQDWSAAEATFGALAGKHPNQAEVVNNLGVARFQLGKQAEAEQSFEEANRLSPGSPQILLNQSMIAFRKLDSPAGIAKQDEARKLAPEVYEGLKNASQAGTEQRAFALPLPDSPARTETLRAGRENSSLAASRPQGPILVFGFLLPLVAMAAFMMRLARSIKQAHATQCVRCGEPFHTTDSPDFEVCSKCHHLFVLKDGLHGDSRKRKVEEIAVFQGAQRWIHRLLVVVAPGADLCFLGDTRHGIVELLFLCAALGVVFATGRSVRYPGEILPDPSSTWLPLGLILLAILFFRSWLKLLPRRRRS
jgi:tetratricopeptide (TPR) repeat protein